MDADAAATGIVATMEFSDPAGLARALRDADIHYISLAGRQFRARLASVNLGPLRLHDVADDAHVTHGVIEGERVAFLFGMGAFPGGTLVNGVPMHVHQAVVLGPAAPIHCRITGHLHWAGLTIDAAALAHAAGERETPRPGAFAFRHLDGPTRSALTATVAEIGAVAAADPARLAFPSVRKGAAETLLRLAGQALHSVRPGDVRLRALHRRVRLVADADDLLAAWLGNPVYSEEIGAALGVSVRTLHDAFVAVHGMSLHRYLRLRRLNQAHEALRGARPGAKQVKDAALDAGFWHLGRFAREYRALFGEAPSETLARHGAA